MHNPSKTQNSSETATGNWLLSNNMYKIKAKGINMTDLRYSRQSPVCLMFSVKKYCLTSAFSDSENELFLLLNTTFFKVVSWVKK